MAAIEWALPRIVCTKCLAVVKVHGWMPSDHEYSSTAWVECCGKHQMVSFRGNLLADIRAVPGRDVILQDATPLTEGVSEWARRMTVGLVANAKRAGWLARYLDAAGKTEDMDVEQRIELTNALIEAAKAIAGNDIAERIGIELLEKFQRGAA